MAVQIRRANSNDAETLALLLRASFAEYEGKLDPPNSAHTETSETVTRTMESGGAFAAVVGDELVGCVFFKPQEDHLYLFRLGVLPKWRGRGIARQLVEAVEAEAVQRGLSIVRLMTRLALTENVAYYERLGYRRRADIITPQTGLPFRADFEKRL